MRVERERLGENRQPEPDSALAWVATFDDRWRTAPSSCVAPETREVGGWKRRGDGDGSARSSSACAVRHRVRSLLHRPLRFDRSGWGGCAVAVYCVHIHHGTPQTTHPSWSYMYATRIAARITTVR
jgi:hypothetical protein